VEGIKTEKIGLLEEVDPYKYKACAAMRGWHGEFRTGGGGEARRKNAFNSQSDALGKSKGRRPTAKRKSQAHGRSNWGD